MAKPDFDIRARLDVTDTSSVIFDLSTEVKNLLRNENLTEALIDILDESKVLYEAAAVMVFQVSPNLVIKISQKDSLITEYYTLSYLRQHLPTFPAPRPHGLVELGQYCLLFTTLVRGLTLEHAWPQLDEAQKTFLSGQIDSLFCSLRQQLPLPANTPLGGVQGGGCKDIRIGTRVASEPIMDTKQYEDFIFAGSRSPSPIWIQLMRDLMPASEARCVFTHGDLRPANIMVDKDKNGTWVVVSIIDWETSGFYPEYWEAVKMTNNLNHLTKDEWYLNLPKSLSLHRYPIQWLVDALRDRGLVNS